VIQHIDIPASATVTTLSAPFAFFRGDPVLTAEFRVCVKGDAGDEADIVFVEVR
jgi:hypothetical protein